MAAQMAVAVAAQIAVAVTAQMAVAVAAQNGCVSGLLSFKDPAQGKRNS